MITFVHGKVDKAKANASLKFGTSEDVVKVFHERDPDGNIKVTMELELEPEHATPVRLVLHDGSDSHYTGLLVKDEKRNMSFAQG